VKQSWIPYNLFSNSRIILCCRKPGATLAISLTLFIAWLNRLSNV